MAGDVQHGWQLYREHCERCHGPGRRGDGEARFTLKTPPKDLRDPLFLLRRTDNDLARVILQGGNYVGRAKDMPGFAQELSEQDVQDVISLLRGDALSLQECFAEATHYRRVFLEEEGPPVLAAWQVGAARGAPPTLLKVGEPLPPDARGVGYLVLTQVTLPGAGPTPIALLADLQGRVTGARVALPEPDAQRARADLEDVLLRQSPRLPTLAPVLEQEARRLARLVRSVPAETARP